MKNNKEKIKKFVNLQKKLCLNNNKLKKVHDFKVEDQVMLFKK